MELRNARTPPDGWSGSGRVDAWVAARVAAAPDAIAIQDRDRRVTYAELDREADRVARMISARGVAPGGLIGVRMRRGWRMYAALLGVWKHGSGYVPVDLSYPSARQDFIVSDSGAGLLVESGEDGFTTRVPDSAPERAPVPPDIAYVLYTSGSTGRPKGVVLRHGNVLAFLDGVARAFRFGSGDIWAQFTSVCFDISVAETWIPLVTGARLVVVPEEAAGDPAAFQRLLSETRVSILSQVPTVFRYLLDAVEEEGTELPSLRQVLLCGEPVEPHTVLRWLKAGVAPDARVHNLYGPTEATVYATWYELTEENLDPTRPTRPGTPIGRALPHVTAAVMDNGGPVPLGRSGEVYLSGPGVAWGYLGLPDRTSRSFVTLDGGTGRWYRTGDLARVERDGLWFEGRTDTQVKLRGLRIELGEVEALLRTHRGVSEAAVLLTRGPTGDPFLVAYYVASPASGGTEAPALRGYLTDRLPPYMVPSRYVAVSEQPLTLNGKLDRKALEGLAHPTTA
ncbi:amino acid adenylation domain-containing protein [Streptomyces sp. NPDC058953]|uniref:amino acid adenylation domain-containing protein n=1 Tax=Streptomyces sp. NPDC058953 TaxID=3346676 RepID=UPI0036783B62